MSGSVQTFSSMTERMVDTPEQPIVDTPAVDVAPAPTINDVPISNVELPTPTPEAAPISEPKEDASDFNFDVDVPALAEPQAQTPAAPVFDWRHELKKVDQKELLKELGIDDFALELNAHIKNGGSAADYLAARAIDYGKIPDDVLLKDDLQKQYPTLSPSQIDLMYKRKYQPHENADQDDIDFFDAQKQADAYKTRQARMAEQQKFQIKENAVPPKDYSEFEQWQQENKNYELRLQQAKDFFINHEATKALNESKRVTVNLGDDVPPYNFQLSRPEVITTTLTDDGSMWNKLISTPQGEPDVPKRQLVTLFALNPRQYTKDIFNYGVSVGKKKLVEEGQNAQRPQARVIPVDANQPTTYGVGKFGDKQR